MDKESINGEMEGSTMVNGRITKWMEGVSSYGQMVGSIR